MFEITESTLFSRAFELLDLKEGDVFRPRPFNIMSQFASSEPSLKSQIFKDLSRVLAKSLTMRVGSGYYLENDTKKLSYLIPEPDLYIHRERGIGFNLERQLVNLCHLQISCTRFSDMNDLNTQDYLHYIPGLTGIDRVYHILKHYLDYFHFNLRPNYYVNSVYYQEVKYLFMNETVCLQELYELLELLSKHYVSEGGFGRNVSHALRVEVFIKHLSALFRYKTNKLLLSGDVESNPGPSILGMRLTQQLFFNLSSIEFKNLESLFLRDEKVGIFNVFNQEFLKEKTDPYFKVLCDNDNCFIDTGDHIDEKLEPYINLTNFINLSVQKCFNIIVFIVDDNKSYLIRTAMTDYTLCFVIDNNLKENFVYVPNYDLNSKLRKSKMSMVQMNCEVGGLLFPGEMLNFSIDGLSDHRPIMYDNIIVTQFDYTKYTSQQCQIFFDDCLKRHDINFSRAEYVATKNSMYAPKPKHFDSHYNVDDYIKNNISMYNKQAEKEDRIDVPYIQHLQVHNYGGGKVFYPLSCAGSIVINGLATREDKLQFASLFSSMPRRIFSKFVINTNNIFVIHRTYLMAKDSSNEIKVFGAINYIVVISPEMRPVTLLAIVSYVEKVFQTCQVISAYSINYGPYRSEFLLLDEGEMNFANIDVIKLECRHKQNVLSEIQYSLKAFMTEYSKRVTDSSLATKIPNIRRILEAQNFKVLIRRETKLNKEGLTLLLHEKNFDTITPTMSFTEVDDRFAYEFGLPLYTRDALAPRLNKRFDTPRMEQLLNCDKSLEVLLSYTTGCFPKGKLKILNKYQVQLPCEFITSVDNPMLHRHTCTLSFQSFKKYSEKVFLHNTFDCNKNLCLNVYLR